MHKFVCSRETLCYIHTYIHSIVYIYAMVFLVETRPLGSFVFVSIKFYFIISMWWLCVCVSLLPFACLLYWIYMQHTPARTPFHFYPFPNRADCVACYIRTWPDQNKTCCCPSPKLIEFMFVCVLNFNGLWGKRTKCFGEFLLENYLK